MNKKSFLLLALIVPGISFADTCPTSYNEAVSRGFVNKTPYVDLSYSSFKGVYWRNGKVFCTYGDGKCFSRQVGVLKKTGIKQPLYGKDTYWYVTNLKDYGTVLACKSSVGVCTFEPVPKKVVKKYKKK